KRALNLGSSLWSGRRGSNSRHPPWQGGILPLNYPRVFVFSYLFIIHAQFFFASTFFNYAGIFSSISSSLLSNERIFIATLSLNALVTLFTKSFEVSTQNMEADKIFALPSISFT